MNEREGASGNRNEVHLFSIAQFECDLTVTAPELDLCCALERWAEYLSWIKLGSLQ